MSRSLYFLIIEMFGGLIGGSVASFVVENLTPLAAIKYKIIGAIAGGAGGYLIGLLIEDLSFDVTPDLDHLIALFASGAFFGGLLTAAVIWLTGAAKS
jgi:hypothetical protein